MDIIRIQLEFTEQTPKGEFKSHLYFTEDEWKKVKPDEIKAKKKVHTDAFITAVETPFVEQELSPAETQARLEEIENEK